MNHWVLLQVDDGAGALPSYQSVKQYVKNLRLSPIAHNSLTKIIEIIEKDKGTPNQQTASITQEKAR